MYSNFISLYLYMNKIRVCRICNSSSEEKEFTWRIVGKTKQNICKECQKEKSKEHYYKNKSAYRKRNEKYAKDRQDFIINHLKNNSCIDCGEDNIICLDFDHIDRNNKSFTIGTYLGNNYKDLNLIKEEIKKCEIRCANCHRIKTAKEMNSYRYRYLKKE